MGKNDSVLPKGGERRAGGHPPRLLGAGWRFPRLRDLPSGEAARWRGGVINEVLWGKSPAISPSPRNLFHSTTRHQSSCEVLAVHREDLQGHLSGTLCGRGPQKGWAGPAGLLQRCVRTSEGLREKCRVPKL